MCVLKMFKIPKYVLEKQKTCSRYRWAKNNFTPKIVRPQNTIVRYNNSAIFF